MQGKNKHGDPIFLLHFFNLLYMVINCAKFEKKIWVVHPFQGNYLKSPDIYGHEAGGLIVFLFP